MTIAKPAQRKKGKVRERVLAGESVAARQDVVLTVNKMMTEEQIECAVFELE